MRILHHLGRATLLAGLALPALAPRAQAMAVFACLPEWGAVAREIVAPTDSVYVVASPLENPDNVQLRPSIVAELAKADIAFCTGNGFEDEWLNPALARAGNPRVQPGKPGFFMASTVIKVLKDLGAKAEGEKGNGTSVHDEGNPHIQGDPRRVRAIAVQFTKRLGQIDPANAAGYNERGKAFITNLARVTDELQKLAAPLKGVSVISQHEDIVYTWDWLGVNVAETIEPEPDVAPGPARLAQVLKTARNGKVRFVVHAAYIDPKPSVYIATESKLPLVKLPFTVGGTPDSKDLPSFYRDTVQRLLDGLAGKSRD